MIDMTKKYRTRDGRDVRILCVDGPGDYPVIGLVVDRLNTWRQNGRILGIDEQRPLDLIEVVVVPDVVVWYAIYPNGFGTYAYTSIVGARASANAARQTPVGYAKVTINNGGQSHTDVTVDVLPVDYTEPTP